MLEKGWGKFCRYVVERLFVDCRVSIPVMLSNETAIELYYMEQKITKTLHFRTLTVS